MGERCDLGCDARSSAVKREGKGHEVCWMALRWDGINGRLYRTAAPLCANKCRCTIAQI